MVLDQFSLCLLIKELRPLIFKDNVVYVLFFVSVIVLLNLDGEVDVLSGILNCIGYGSHFFPQSMYFASPPLQFEISNNVLWSYLFIILCLYVSTWMCLFLVCVNFLTLFCWIPGLCQWLRIFFFSCAYNFKFLFFYGIKISCVFFPVHFKFFMIPAYLPIYSFHFWYLIYSLLLDLFYI